MPRFLSLIAPALVLVLSGCSLAPDYQRPELDLPQAWEETQPQAFQDKWWERFNDPVLNSIVEEVLANNKNITEMAIRVEQAQASLGMARSYLFPIPAASADGTRTMARSADSPIAMKSGGKNTHSFSGGLAASWTLDFWGKYWNAAQSVRESLVATEAARDNVVLSVVASTVESYLGLSSFTWQEELATSVLKNREEALRIYQNRFDNGQISDLDILSIKANVETARNALASARMAKNSAETSLAVLLGRSPADIMNGLGIKATLLTSLANTPALPSGIPSTLLDKRPDIRQAEAKLRAANYDIGTARAAYFPSFSLTGLLGSASIELDDLLRSSNQYAALSGGVSLPLNFWSIKRSVYIAEAEKQAAVNAYELAVLSAFKDVRDALVNQTEQANSVQALSRQVGYLEQALGHARTLYDNGFASYLELLTTETNLFSAQQALAAAHASHLASIARVCLALGGSWND